MRTQRAFCSACDRDVNIILPDEPVWEGHATLRDAEVVCLEMGDKCTGALCPIGALPPAVMAVRLIRSGQLPVIQPLIDAPCECCNEVTQFAVIKTDYATCTVCGITVNRTTLDPRTSNSVIRRPQS